MQLMAFVNVKAYLGALSLSSITINGSREKLFNFFGSVLGKTEGEQTEWKDSKKENGKEWKGFVYKHRDSFSKNKFAALDNSAKG